MRKRIIIVSIAIVVMIIIALICKMKTPATYEELRKAGEKSDYETMIRISNELIDDKDFAIRSPSMRMKIYTARIEGGILHHSAKTTEETVNYYEDVVKADEEAFALFDERIVSIFDGFHAFYHAEYENAFDMFKRELLMDERHYGYTCCPIGDIYARMLNICFLLRLAEPTSSKYVLSDECRPMLVFLVHYEDVHRVFESLGTSTSFYFHPTSPYWMYLRASKLTILCDYASAFNLCKRIIEDQDQKTNHKALLLMGKIHFFEGRYNDACNCLSELVDQLNEDEDLIRIEALYCWYFSSYVSRDEQTMIKVRDLYLTYKVSEDNDCYDLYEEILTEMNKLTKQMN